MKPRKRGHLAAVGGLPSGPVRESRPCPECGGPTDADARCGACRLYASATEPPRTCPKCQRRWPTAANRAGLNPDGFCWGCRAYTGPRLERVATPEGWAYAERETPVLAGPPEEQLRRLRALAASLFGRSAREPGEDVEAEQEARRRRLADQAAALRAQAQARRGLTP